MSAHVSLYTTPEPLNAQESIFPEVLLSASILQEYAAQELMSISPVQAAILPESIKSHHDSEMIAHVLSHEKSPTGTTVPVSVFQELVEGISQFSSVTESTIGTSSFCVPV